MNIERSDRIVFKSGEVNAVKRNVGRRIDRYFKDIFTSLIDAKWRYTLLIFTFTLLFSWSLFAVFWFSLAVAHHDITFHDSWIGSGNPDRVDGERLPCVRHLYSLVSAVLFSIETQQTIGYGFRHVTESCAGGPILLITQSIIGTLIQAFLIGVIIAKLVRPKKRVKNVLFSKNAVVCLREGSPYLMFRIIDTRKSHIVQAFVKGWILRKKMTKEGELINFYQQDLNLCASEESGNQVLLMWPTVVVHKIDSTSPLYGISAQDLRRERFEIFISLEGAVESTGLATQARTSYLPGEILWGHRFQPITTFDERNSEYEVDYRLFHSTYEVEMPLHSAKAQDEIRIRESALERKAFNEPNGHVTSQL